MKNVYLIKDEKVGFLNIIVDENDYIAKFNFGLGFAKGQPEFGRLEDYSLYNIGLFDVKDYDISNNPKFICNGLTAYNDFIQHVNSLHLDKLEKGCEHCADSNISKENK